MHYHCTQADAKKQSIFNFHLLLLLLLLLMLTSLDGLFSSILALSHASFYYIVCLPCVSLLPFTFLWFESDTCRCRPIAEWGNMEWEMGWTALWCSNFLTPDWFCPLASTSVEPNSYGRLSGHKKLLFKFHCFQFLLFFFFPLYFVQITTPVAISRHRSGMTSRCICWCMLSV